MGAGKSSEVIEKDREIEIGMGQELEWDRRGWAECVCVEELGKRERGRENECTHTSTSQSEHFSQKHTI